MAVEKLPWLSIELDREEDGRWIAEVPELPGVICYGRTRETAISAAILLSVSVIRDTARAIAARTSERSDAAYAADVQVSAAEYNDTLARLATAQRENVALREALWKALEWHHGVCAACSANGPCLWAGKLYDVYHARAALSGEVKRVAPLQHHNECQCGCRGDPDEHTIAPTSPAAPVQPCPLPLPHDCDRAVHAATVQDEYAAGILEQLRCGGANCTNRNGCLCGK